MARRDGQGAMQGRVAELGTRFLRRTESELVALIADIERSTDPLDAATLSRVLALAHRIRGSGGALGFDSISRQALELMTLARTAAPGRAALVSCVARLLRSIELDPAPTIG